MVQGKIGTRLPAARLAAPSPAMRRFLEQSRLEERSRRRLHPSRVGPALVWIIALVLCALLWSTPAAA